MSVRQTVQNTCISASHQQQVIGQLPYWSITRLDSHLPQCVVTPCPATTYISDDFNRGHDMMYTSRQERAHCRVRNVTKLFLGHVIFFITKHYEGFVSSLTLGLLQLSVKTKCFFFQLFQSRLWSIYSPFFSNWKNRQQFFSKGSPVIAESKESLLKKAA